MMSTPNLSLGSRLSVRLLVVRVWVPITVVACSLRGAPEPDLRIGLGLLFCAGGLVARGGVFGVTPHCEPCNKLLKGGSFVSGSGGGSGGEGVRRGGRSGRGGQSRALQDCCRVGVDGVRAESAILEVEMTGWDKREAVILV